MFIEDERNNVLKEYGFGARQGVTIYVGPFFDGNVSGVTTPTR